MSREDEGEAQLRQRKLEEVLEVQSLRRIISAYLNYPDAAEEDVRRYERSYRKLSPAHKALIPHYPLKFQKQRWCISVNTRFIYNMLQDFDPPLDLSLDMDVCEDPNLEASPDYKIPMTEKSIHSCQVASLSSSLFCESDQSKQDEGCTVTCRSPQGLPNKEELGIQNSCASLQGNGHQDPENDWKTNIIFSDAVGVMNSNGNVFCSSRAWLHPSSQLNVPLVDVDKVRCIVRNIVRDWAVEGQMERDQCYNPILDELDTLFPNRDKDSPPSCLVPGAGLGRLALEISSLGFISQGNEFSYYMMICSSFILNQAQTAGEWTIYPWIHSNCNSLSDDDQLRPVSIPDIHPASAGITKGFSMCGGDFVEVYSDLSQVAAWDAVVTCFFLDTAHNIIEYVEIISRILKDGGVWINLGPLLYHFADMYGQQDEMSIELSLEDVKKIILYYGFVFEKERTIETTYTTNPRSMMQNRYYAAFWTMKKKSGAIHAVR